MLMSTMQQARMCGRQSSAVVLRLHTELHMCTCLLQCTLPAALANHPDTALANHPDTVSGAGSGLDVRL
jgi:hypothetical protein